MSFQELEQELPERLSRPLPGVEAQLALSPRPRFGWRPGQLPDDCRESGVLLLLYPKGDAAHFVLTVRDHNLPQHGGQVSLPGGAVEGEESVERAALREAHEEVGVEPRRVRIVGPLSPLHVPVSRFVLYPTVGVAGRRPDLVPDEREVARILEVPLDDLLDPAKLSVERRESSRGPVEVPYFALEGEQVWGATAMVLAEFLSVLGQRPDPWR